MSTPTKAKHFDLFIDSDGVIADFDKMMKSLGMTADEFKHEPGAYTYLEPMPGVEDALKQLKQLDDLGEIRVWVATKTPAGSPYSYTEKVLWFRWHFPWLEDRVILCHDKSLLGCGKDMLIDDRPHKGNAALFRGRFIHFASPACPDWKAALKLIYEHLFFRRGDDHRALSQS